MKALVKYTSIWETDTVLKNTSFYDDEIADFIKSMRMAKKYKIPCYFNEEKDSLFYISNIKIQAPTEEDMFVINVIIDYEVDEYAEVE